MWAFSLSGPKCVSNTHTSTFLDISYVDLMKYRPRLVGWICSFCTLTIIKSNNV